MIKLRWTLSALSALSALAVMALVGTALVGTSPALAAGKDGKTIFLDNKCNMCHTINSQAIAQIPDPEAEEGDEVPEPKDLSNVGADHDAKWIKGWLEKKIEKEGKTHRKKFNGEPSDLTTLVSWLAALKQPAK